MECMKLIMKEERLVWCCAGNCHFQFFLLVVVLLVATAILIIYLEQHLLYAWSEF